MRLINSTKKCSGTMNSKKNKLNSKIIWQKISYPSKALEWNEFSPTFYLVTLQNNVLSDYKIIE